MGGVLALSAVRRGRFDGTAIKPISNTADIPKALEVRTGDFLITRSNTRNRVGDVCIATDVRPRTIISDLIYRLSVDTSILEPRLLMYQLLSLLGRRQIERDARGSSSSMPKIAQGHIRNWRVILPPPDEQRLIIRFLDMQAALTARFILAKRRLIALLNEQKHAIIHRAVIRGLDSNVRLRPSGVEWLGDVPEHWRIAKLRHCGSIFGGMTPSMSESSFWGGDVPWVTPKDMKCDVIHDAQIHVTTEALQQTSLKIIPASSVLMVVRGMILARRVPIAETATPVTVNQDMKAIIPAPNIVCSFLAKAMCAAQAAFVPLIDESGHGTKRFPTERWRDLLFAFPPKEEQLQIVEFLSEATTELDEAISTVSRETELLREYHTRLIADVVTGKLDVRAAAAALPETAEKPQAFEAALETGDYGETMEETGDDNSMEEVAA